MDRISRYWWNGLVGILGATYIYLGTGAAGLARILGIAGGLFILAGAISRRWRFSPWLVVVGALPLAALTWWSVATPLVGVLAIAFGWRMFRDQRRQASVAE